MVFTAENWDQPKSFTITSVDDDVDDGDVTFVIQTEVASNDPLYDGFGVADATVTNLDDDTVGISVNRESSLVTVEGGNGDEFTVVLDTEPTSEVTITLTAGDGTEGSLSPDVLTFTAADWDQPRAVTVSPVDDDIDDGNVSYAISIDATADDANYDGLQGPGVSVINYDDDTAGITVSGESLLVTDESGSGDEFTVALDTEPTSAVTITLTPSDDTEGEVSPGVLTFTPADWDQPRVVTVSGIDDDVDDGNVNYTIGASVTADDSIYDWFFCVKRSGSQPG